MEGLTRMDLARSRHILMSLTLVFWAFCCTLAIMTWEWKWLLLIIPITLLSAAFSALMIRAETK
jgi:ABC-type multidrug transport system permease subunit